MRKVPLLCSAVIMCAVLGYGQASGPQRQPNSANPPSTTAQRAMLDQYCVGCHNDQAKQGGLSLEKLDMTQVGRNAELWEKVVRKLRAGMMPPSGASRPDSARYEALTVSLETALDRAAPQNLRMASLHRLNRTEYANAIRDLIDVEIDVNEFLPSDDSAFGFDTVATALNVSATLLQGYVAAAGKISSLALGSAVALSEKMYLMPTDGTQNYHVEGLPFGTRGGMLMRHYFPVDGEYGIKISGLEVGSVAKGEQLEVMIDGGRAHVFDWDKDIFRNPENPASQEFNEIKIPVKAGLHIVGVTFVSKNYAPNVDLSKHFKRSTLENNAIDGFTEYPHIASVSIRGPYAVASIGDTASRRKIFVCRPANQGQEAACARQIISTLARRAYRRPTNAEDLESLMEFYDAGREKGGFDSGIEMALRRILSDPEFIFRIEATPANVAEGRAYRISDLELASRLSFFLWSTNPDDELINLATRGQLRNQGTLERQVRRMLADPRSRELVRNFAGQWLNLRGLAVATRTATGFPDFDDNLRQGFRQETELFFESIVREDRSIVDLLTADYTFVNERLAQHYGIPNVYGSQFRRVTLGNGFEARRGLLGQGSFLTVTSLATRTSPVQRGKWVLQNLLGTNPPEPPPLVPMLEDSKSVTGPQSLRQQMETHRTNPACASCHRIMDPIGFALENFDATGRWRTEDGGVAINTSDKLVDGSPVNGPATLRQELLRYSPQYVRNVTEKLMIYALGRGVEHQDMPLVRSIVRDAAPNNYRFSALVIGIVKSAPFQMRMRFQESTTATP